MQPVFAALVPLRFQDGAGGGVDGVLVLAEVVVELDLILGAAVVMVELGLDKVDPRGAQARVLQGNLLGALHTDVAGGAAGGGGRDAVALDVGVVGEDGAVSGKNLVVILLVAGVEIDVVGQPAVVVFALRLDKDSVGSGDTRVLQGDFFSLLRADVGRGGAGGGRDAVALDVGVVGEDGAVGSKDFIVVLLVAGIKLYFIGSRPSSRSRSTLTNLAVEEVTPAWFKAISWPFPSRCRRWRQGRC